MVKLKSKSVDQLLTDYETLVAAQLNEERWFACTIGQEANELYAANTKRITQERHVIMSELRRRNNAGKFSRNAKRG